MSSIGEVFTDVGTEECFYCKKKFSAICYQQTSGDERWFYELPSGWYVADSYPPGDDGLYFACSVECMKKGAG